MPGRTYSSSTYRYGFNGKEKDNEMKGEGNAYDFGMRIYDPRIGRWLSIDPRIKEYPWQTPYSYHRNNPINITDYLGGGDPPDKNEVKFVDNKGAQIQGIKAFKFKGSTMTPFVSGDKTLSEAGKSQDQPNTTDYTINAQFLEGRLFFNNQGKAYANGKELPDGASQPGWSYISSDGKGGYTFGQGDPPANSKNAVGGGRPLILNGLAYGTENKYSDGRPNNAGPVADADKQFLTQKSANYFSAQNSVTKGKTIVAYNPTSKEVMIIVQQDGVHGYSMDGYRNYLAKNGFTNALSFDGSDSALMLRDKDVLIKNGETKDKYTDSGVTFRVPVSK